MDTFYWVALIAFLTAMGLLIGRLGEKRRRQHYLYDKNPMTPYRKQGADERGNEGGTK